MMDLFPYPHTLPPTQKGSADFDNKTLWSFRQFKK
jgi:hypothetical protein